MIKIMNSYINYFLIYIWLPILPDHSEISVFIINIIMNYFILFLYFFPFLMINILKGRSERIVCSQKNVKCKNFQVLLPRSAELMTIIEVSRVFFTVLATVKTNKVQTNISIILIEYLGFM